MVSFLETKNAIEYEICLYGLTEETVRKISFAQNEPSWMLEHRLRCLKIFFEKTKGKKNFGLTWGPSLKKLDLDKIVRYARPKEGSKAPARDRKDVPQELKDKFEKLGIPEAERKYLAGAGGQMDSWTIYHKIKEKRAEKGVIFEDMVEALQKYETLIRGHFMQLVPPSDHVFAALHGAVWSGGTFVYIPSQVEVSDPLQAYFRMNTYGGGQFEHTLIIVGDDAVGSYIEGCSAPKYDQASLHVGMVEIFVGKRAKMRYSSVENWSTNTYNLNTKRALVDDDGCIERVSGNLGSCTTMLYPCSVLKGKNSSSESLGIVLASTGQEQDIGSKVIHIGPNTTSKIISKSISKGNGKAIYRGLVKILPTAHEAVNMTVCDGLLIDKNSISQALPTIDVKNQTATVSHEASAGKINEEHLFYIMTRGFTTTKATSMLVHGFLSEVTKKLPLEYASEINKLIEIELE